MCELAATERRLSVSTWSLHRTLGSPQAYGPGDEIGTTSRAAGAVALTDLPKRLADFGIQTLEICHFHLPDRTEGYLAELRAALEDAEVELFSLLIDGGDITDPGRAERDLAWIEQWIEVAEKLGAKCARAIAGKAAPSDEAIALSKSGLRRLAGFAKARNVRLMTENWLGLMSSPPIVLDVLGDLDGDVGLCLDFGNWSGQEKYAELAQIFPRAESCHAKCHFDQHGVMDADDFARCLALSDAAGFEGPYTLIYDGPDPDEWTCLERERALVAAYLPS